MIQKNPVKNGYLKNRNFSEEKETHPEHKYSVTFVTKVRIITLIRTGLLLSGQSNDTF